MKAERDLFHGLHGRALLDASQKDPLPTGLPDGHPLTLRQADLLDDAKLFAYAQALEDNGQPDAAKQVRLVLEKVPAAIGADEPGRP